MEVEAAVASIFEVEGGKEAPEDGDVCRVGPSGGSVFVFKRLDEAQVERMEECRSGNISRIRLTQVGDPLAHRE